MLLTVASSFRTVFTSLTLAESYTLAIAPAIFYLIICLKKKPETQVMVGALMSSIYSMVMTMVLVATFCILKRYSTCLMGFCIWLHYPVVMCFWLFIPCAICILLKKKGANGVGGDSNKKTEPQRPKRKGLMSFIMGSEDKKGELISYTRLNILKVLR